MACQSQPYALRDLRHDVEEASGVPGPKMAGIMVSGSLHYAFSSRHVDELTGFLWFTSEDLIRLCLSSPRACIGRCYTIVGSCHLFKFNLHSAVDLILKRLRQMSRITFGSDRVLFPGFGSLPGSGRLLTIAGWPPWPSYPGHLRDLGSAGQTKLISKSY